MYTTRRLLFMSLLLGGLFLGGITLSSCGDDNDNPNDLCNRELCNDNATLKAQCVDEVSACQAAGRSNDECAAIAADRCTI